jgi:predicted nucleotidyltransferase
MNDDSVAEVWNMLDREQLGGLADSGPTVVFATVSGAHLYGFASPNSDVDLRGAYLLPVRDFLRLTPPNETTSVSEIVEGIDLDWVAHDLKKFVRMLLCDNGYALEQLYSPLVVRGGDLHAELEQLARGCVTRGLFRHYRGFAHGRRKLLAAEHPTVKHLLYAYRVYLTGIWALEHGDIESNLPELNQHFRLAQVDELIARKREGHEKLELSANEPEQHGRWLDELEARLASAHERSTLPESARGRDALDDFVVRARIGK